MSRKSRYSTEFKQDAVSRMGQGGQTVTALAEQLVFGGSSYTCGVSSCRLAARRRLSEAREGRRDLVLRPGLVLWKNRIKAGRDVIFAIATVTSR